MKIGALATEAFAPASSIGAVATVLAECIDRRREPRKCVDDRQHAKFAPRRELIMNDPSTTSR
jgi:hypothetical protein